MNREEVLKDLIKERDLEKANRDFWDEEEDRVRSDRYVEMLDIAIRALEQELKIGRCKDCKYFNEDMWVDGIFLMHNICQKWGQEKWGTGYQTETEREGYCFMFEQKEG